MIHIALSALAPVPLSRH